MAEIHIHSKDNPEPEAKPMTYSFYDNDGTLIKKEIYEGAVITFTDRLGNTVTRVRLSGKPFKMEERPSLKSVCTPEKL